MADLQNTPHRFIGDARTDFALDPKRLHSKTVDFIPSTFVDKYGILGGGPQFNLTHTTQFPLHYLAEVCPSTRCNADLSYISIQHKEATQFYQNIEYHLFEMAKRTDDSEFYRQSMIEFLTTTNINALYPKNVALYCNVKGGLLTTAHIGSAMTNIILSKQLPIGARAQQYFGGFRILGTLYLFGITASALSDICGCNVVGRGLATASFCLLKPFELAQNVTNLVTAVPERMRLGYTAPITVATNLLSGQGLRITDIKECKQAINSALSMFK